MVTHRWLIAPAVIATILTAIIFIFQGIPQVIRASTLGYSVIGNALIWVVFFFLGGVAVLFVRIALGRFTYQEAERD